MTDLFAELGARFERADRRLFLVGGSVRDMVLGREPKDLDFTTDALPHEIEGILAFGGWADAIWDIGREFGTIAARKGDDDIEITTFRFDGPGRKPEVTFTDSLVEDLERRDFTINAMAMHVDHLGLHSHGSDIEDPFNGIVDLGLELIDTPRDPVKTFIDDPLRMLRAARFVSQLGFRVSDVVDMAMETNARLIDTISAERIAAELDKLLMGEFPQRGLAVLRDTGLLKRILPELTQAAVTVRGDDVETRWADLLANTDIAAVARRMRALKFSLQRQRAVTELIRLRQQFSGVSWLMTGEQTVRRVLASAGDHLEALRVLMDDEVFNARLDATLAAEGHPEPFLTGQEVMDALDEKPGPRVGEAMRFLWGLRLDQGPMNKTDVLTMLVAWNSVKENA